MNIAQNVVHEVNEVDKTLQLLGITSQQLREIVSKGQMIRATVTNNHPQTAAGTFVYHETVRAKRDILMACGWTSHTVNNCELTAHPGKNITISVSGGNKETGNQYGTPQTKNPKGSQTELLVVENSNQLDMFSPNNEQQEDKLDDTTCQNWMLLYYPDFQNNEVRLELSLPTSIGRNGKVNNWRLRLILEPIQLDPESDATYEPDYAPEPDIQIERKGQD